MTRVLCPRTSRRKKSNLKQEVEEEDGKENVPLLYRQVKEVTAKNKMPTLMKENISLNPKTSSRLNSANNGKEPLSPVRKSTRRTKYNKQLNRSIKVKTDRNVLCDKTNTPRLLDKMTSSVEQILEVPVLKTEENKNKILHKLMSLPKLKTDALSKNQVPVYKSGGNLQGGLDNVNPSIEKKEAIYEFEVDENEEPVQKKKRKKRVYNRKPKIGPKALTINNIKYSSTESLVTLPEKHIARKKRTPKSMKTNIKSLSHVTSLTNFEDTCSSISSFSSHPPSLKLCKDRKAHNENPGLSILLESQSELSPNHTAADDHDDVLLQSEGTSSFSAGPEVNNKVSVPNTQDIVYSPKPRCYRASKNTFLHQPSPCPTNSSCISSQDFLSSTPCKRVSAVIHNNSMFEDSLDLPNSDRQNIGCVKNVLITTKNTVDNYFGFDEPEELEEPLVSPIKSNIDLGPRWAGKKPSPHRSAMNELEIFKPSTQEVIEMLKASIPKDNPKQGVTDVFDSESEDIDSSLPQNTDEDVVCTNFRKPPRRSYERQRRVRYHSETEEVCENDDCDKASDKQEVEGNVLKGGKKCYKRINTTRSAKPPKITKAKQREAKEAEEMERLAAMMNAQFQEIDKVSLVVE